jgi:hypothetical protein
MPGQTLVRLGKAVLVVGLALIALGLGLSYGGRYLGWLGHLPGDIRVEREGFGFYLPLATCLLISLIVTVVLKLLSRR